MSLAVVSSESSNLYRRSFLFSCDAPMEDIMSSSVSSTVISAMATKSTEKEAKDAVVQPEEPSNPLQDEARRLRDLIKQERKKYADITLKDACGKIPDVSLVSPVQSMKARKVLKHDWKLISFSWSPDQRHVITGGDNGCAIIWDAFTSQKKCVIETNCGKVLTVSYGPSTTIVACGGLNKKCSIYKLTEGVEVIKRPKMDVAIHRSYITDSVFLGSDQQLLTSSADGRIYLWDMENDAPVQEFIGHKSEVMSIATQQSDPYSVFASCGNDQSARLWDVRAGKCVKNFDEHNSEVNSVKFFPTGAAIATADNSGVAHLLDLKADQEVMHYSKPTILQSASSLDFSRSGRLLFIGYDDCTLRSWDVLKGVQLGINYDHEDRLSQVTTSPDGTAVGTISWDTTLRVWA